MAVMKALEFEQNSQEKSCFNLNDIAHEAQAIIDKAQQEKQRILQQGQQELDQLRETTQTKGFQQGYDEGIAQGQKEGHQQALEQAQKDFRSNSENLVNALVNICCQFDQEKNRILWQAEQSTVALTVAIARKVVKNVAELSAQVALENVKAALELTSKTTRLTIQINPKDWDHLQEMLREQNSLLGDYSNITFEKATAVSPGSCQLFTSQGSVDADLDKQIDRIAAELLTVGKTGTDGNCIENEIMATSALPKDDASALSKENASELPRGNESTLPKENPTALPENTTTEKTRETVKQ